MLNQLTNYWQVQTFKHEFFCKGFWSRTWKLQKWQKNQLFL